MTPKTSVRLYRDSKTSNRKTHVVAAAVIRLRQFLQEPHMGTTMLRYLIECCRHQQEDVSFRPSNACIVQQSMAREFLGPPDDDTLRVHLLYPIKILRLVVLSLIPNYQEMPVQYAWCHQLPTSGPEDRPYVNHRHLHDEASQNKRSIVREIQYTLAK